MKKKNIIKNILTIGSLFLLSHQVILSYEVQNLDDIISGSVSYLKHTQIKNRRGKGDCRYDFSGGDGCDGKTKNINGEWVNYIHPLILTSAKHKNKRSLLIADSNMFVTGAILYPLYWIQDSSGEVDKVRRSALKSIKSYKKGEAYSFWPKYKNIRSGDDIVGPVNFRVDGYDISDSIAAKVASNILGLSMPWVKEWMTVLMDSEKNPDGFSSFLNVPNDADDTSVAMALRTIQAKRDSNYSNLNLSPLHRITEFRDIDRKKHDKRDTWTPQNTGAYLTWMKDENASLFGDLESGVMPMGINNVDCVVNANVVFALSLNNMTTSPGYNESLNYLASMTKSGQWLKSCALYYPQNYTFAYSVTRAFRDGGAYSIKLDESMNYLMKDLLKEQKKEGKWCIGPDNSCDYATAMAITSLLNLGERRAKNLGLISEYKSSIERGFKFLSNSKTEVSMVFKGKKITSYSWKPGLFFAAEDYRLGVWRSNALSNAITIEAIAKYLSGYHKSSVGLSDWKNKYQVK